MAKVSKIDGMKGAKCPKCRKEKMFVYPWWNVLKFSQMHKECTTCGQRYEVEPGFFYGAMYVSYALTVAMVITCMVVLNLIYERPETYQYIGMSLICIVGFAPFTFRIARVVYIYMLGGIEYKGDETKKD